MRRMRLGWIAFASFLATFLGGSFMPGHVGRQLVSLGLCSVLSFNTGICLISPSSGAAVAALPPQSQTQSIDTADFTLPDQPSFNVEMPSLDVPSLDVADTGTEFSTSDRQIAQALCSTSSGRPSMMTFKNSSSKSVDVFWVDSKCKEVKYSTLLPGRSIMQSSFLNHIWRIRDSATRQEIRTVASSSTVETIEIKDPARTQLIAFQLSAAKQIAAGQFQLEMTSTQREGCRFISTIRKNGSQIYQEAIEFIAANPATCGMSSYKSTFQPGGNKIATQIGNEIFSLNATSTSAAITYRNPVGTTVPVGSFALKPKPSAGGNTETSQLCEFFKKACDVVSSISDGSFITGPISAALQKAYPQLMTVSQSKDVSKITGLALAPALSSVIAKYIPVLGTTLMIGEFTCWFLIKGGLPPIPVLEKATNSGTNFAYSVAGSYATSEVTSTIDKGLETIRKALGIDICGSKKADDYSVTLSNNNIPYQQSAQLKIKFNNSKNNTGKIEVTGSGFSSIRPHTYNIPASMRSQGEITANIVNQGYQMDYKQCDSSTGYVNVAIIGTNGESLFNKQFQPVTYVGKLSTGIYPCSARVTW